MTDQANELNQRIEAVFKSIEKPVNRENIAFMMDELDYRGQWLAESAQIMADAQLILEVKRAKEAIVIASDHADLSAGERKVLLEGVCSEENRLYTRAERLNATLSRQMDEVRTFISAEKDLTKIR